jgi:predicted TIM-barrel fold metal-dependent hydrolase
MICISGLKTGSRRMVIDGHAHSCGSFYSGEKIIEILDELKVDKVVLTPGQINDQRNYNFPGIARLFPNRDVVLKTNKFIRLLTLPAILKKNLLVRNEFVYRLSRQYPDRIIQFFWVNPNNSNVIDELEDKYSKWNVKGIKTHQCIDAFDSDSWMMYSLAEFAREKHIPIFIHLYLKADVMRFLKLAKDNPETNFIIAHLIGLEIFEEAGLKIQNVYFDISPTRMTSEKRIMKAINLLGADHLILGSDTPYGNENLRTNIEKVNRLKISQDHKELIMGRNMQRILGL